jgi:DNA-binding transcriptional regulator YiaG
MKQLRPYQDKLAKEALLVLTRLNIVYLTMEVRTGKTATALEIAKLYGAKNVLFATKKKAISSILDDYAEFAYTFNITVVNDESLHKVDEDFDLVIHDEHHRFGAFPKPNKVAKIFKDKYGHLPMIFLSGTPSPESHSQWFHQFWISNHSPFKYANFYKWCQDYVNVKDKRLGYAIVKDYSEGREKEIKEVVNPYLITFTQAEAGFTTTVEETILEVEMKPITYTIIERLKRDQFVKNPEGDLILGDTGVKMMQKCHQLYSGTVKFEDATRKVIDDSKAVFINDKFKEDKIAIFYKFTAEYDCIKATMGDKITNDLEEFNTTDKWIALQIVSGREGISLKAAKYLVYYNIDFSAVSYWQSRDRLTTMERQHNEVFWIFAKRGIEKKIYKTVMEKKDYTLKIFKQDARAS